MVLYVTKTENEACPMSTGIYEHASFSRTQVLCPQLRGLMLISGFVPQAHSAWGAACTPERSLRDARYIPTPSLTKLRIGLRF